MGHVAVLDVGKTNTKAVLVDTSDLSELEVLRIASPSSEGPPYLHFDTERIWRFALSALSEFAAKSQVDAVCATTHGAAAALVDENGDLVLPVLDYMDEGPDELASDYDALRPPFADTGTPRLPAGLNLGAQLYWLSRRFPDTFRRARWILPYPQYWSMRLSGVPSADVTMLGAHSDLWLPSENRLSKLAEIEGWDRMIPDVRMPDYRLGPVSKQVSEATGLGPGTQVLCGIHDSNASLVPHIIARPPPFTVVSTGTWVITMSVGGRKIELEEARDTLINVNCLGKPVPSARFMGGREFEMLVPNPDVAAGNDIALDVARRRLAVLPTITEGCGPFPGRPVGRIGIGAEDRARRLVGISYYLAMMSAECVAVTGGNGPIIVEGPMAANRHFLDLLSVAVPRPVIKRPSGTGTAAGAALLASADRSAAYAISDEIHQPDPELAIPLKRYAEFWREAVDMA